MAHASTGSDTSTTSSSRSNEPALTRVIIYGAGGRMGRRLCELASQNSSFLLCAALDREGSSEVGQPSVAGSTTAPRMASVSSLDVARGGVDVVIDFSTAESTDGAIDLALKLNAALLVGTTGLNASTSDHLKAASKTIPALLAANTSLGVAVLADAAKRVAAALGGAKGGYECSIVEAHHSAKKDAPSGTAKRLAAAVRDGGGVDAIKDDQVLAIRGGDVIGEHTIRFAGPGEYIELTHRATSRDLFVRGALRAAAWLKGRPAGWYTIEDTLK